MYQRIWVGQPQSCCHRVLKTTRRCANSRQHTSWQPKGSNCEKAPGHTISYNTLSHPEILLYVWQHIVAKVGEYNPKPGIPENTDVCIQAAQGLAGHHGAYLELYCHTVESVLRLTQQVFVSIASEYHF